MIPRSGYSAEIDCAPHVEGAQARIRELRKEFRPLGIHIRPITLSNENGNLELALRSGSRTRLRKWLDSNGYEGTKIINNVNPNMSIARES